MSMTHLDISHELVTELDAPDCGSLPSLYPLDPKHGPEFPLEALPGVLRDMVRETAHSYQVPSDLPASLILAACAAAIGKQYRVQVKPDWTESCNLYIAVAMPPASRKSPVFKTIMEPLEELEKKHWKKHGDQIKEQSRQRAILEKSLKQAENKAAKAETIEEQQKALELISDLERRMPEVTKPLRILADDITPEKAANLLCENHGRLAIMSSEGGIFDTIAGRYSQNVSNLDVFLKAFSGDMLRVDRMGRETEIIENPCLTIGLTFQQSIFTNFNSKSEFRGRGLLGRFLFCSPVDMIGYRLIDTPSIFPAIRAKYTNAIRALAANIDTDNATNFLMFSSEAKSALSKFQYKIESEMQPGERLSSISDWGGKLVGSVIRIAGILHAVKYEHESSNLNIEVETIISAIAIGEYFIGHAEVVFNLMVGDAITEKCHKIMDWIKTKGITRVSARDIQQGLRGTFKRSSELSPVINKLINNNYLIPVKMNKTTRPGRKPSQEFIVHALLASQYTHNTQIYIESDIIE
mgnify:CR=1 FL=1